MSIGRLLHRIALGTLVCSVLGLTGCVLAPFIDSVKRSGAFEKDRQAALYKDMQTFQTARYWQSPADMGAFIDSDASPNLSQQLSPRRKEERITESEVENVVFAPDSYEADVDIIVRLFKLSSNVVQERKEHQVWKFSHSGGWKILSLHERPEA